MTSPVLEIKNICKSFGALKASDMVSLDVLPGEIHALIGPNGAGKSTLIGQIAGTIKPDFGQIMLAGEDITQKSVSTRSRLGLGRSFQISSLSMGISARSNVMLAIQARQGHSFKFWQQIRDDQALICEANDILAKLDITDRANILTEELSHGERRQLEVACALALHPKVLLLDEPMAGIGPGGTAELSSLLGQLKDEAPILLIEHDMDVVFKLADRISVLVYGKVVMSGNALEVKSSPIVREAYLGEDD